MAAHSASQNLWIRIAASAVLAPVAFAVAYSGGWLFVIFWSVAALAVLWEWIRLAIGPSWMATGVVYAALLAIAPVVLRGDAQFGFAAIMLLFAVVWTTDVLGYFVGRAVGGPKLAPRISPNKTWSGSIGGMVGAIIAAIIVARWCALAVKPIVIVGIVLSVASQAGDLLESWIKRRFDAKDTSALIPGHGGVMDRLDGFWAASVAALLIGLFHGGVDAPARGLLLW